MSQLKKVFSKLNLVKNRKNIHVLCDMIRVYQMKKRENSLKKGYEEMAFVNLSLAEMCLDADNEALRQYEEKLTECE